ncbi:hypothetical protein [Streptomyces sp. NPDC026673]|uniref:hypothetical protein n=1 Tax=Streptomyces sp. NPDC026673 TaxID=3155724 RepID=UPI0033FF46F2
MGWSGGPRPAAGSADDPWGDAGRAAAVATYCAVAVVAGTADLVVSPALKSSYGPYEGALGLCFLPLTLIPVWACVVAVSLLHALPATVLGHRLAARTGLPRPLCLLAVESAFAAVLAVPIVWLDGSYPLAWAVIAAAGAVPVLVTSFYARRPDPEGKSGWARQKQVALQVSVATIAVVGLVLAGGLLAYGTGLLQEYRPPSGVGQPVE